MKALLISDVECPALWDYFRPERLRGADLIISCGDLKREYLEFLVTMSGKPVFYVPGNHDGGYVKNPPEGCECLDDKVICYRGVRFLGFGGCKRYNLETYQYTEKEMTRRIRRAGRQIRKNGARQRQRCRCARQMCRVLARLCIGAQAKGRSVLRFWACGARGVPAAGRRWLSARQSKSPGTAVPGRGLPLAAARGQAALGRPRGQGRCGKGGATKTSRLASFRLPGSCRRVCRGSSSCAAGCAG